MINLDSSTVFECETLFLQPSWHCAKNCNACYVKEKEHKFGSEEMDLNLWLDLLLYIGTKKKISTNQVTLALDTLPTDLTSIQYEKMYTIARRYQALVAFGRTESDIKFHLTVNCVSDLEKYSTSELFEGLDLISISNINSLNDIVRIKQCAPHTKINWNVLAGSFIKKTDQQIKEILRNVSQAYLLLHKAPLGEQGHDFDSINQALKRIPSMFSSNDPQEVDGDNCPIPSLINKVILDGCMRDAFTFRAEGTGCASNISRFQIWPDGRVTGCAYNSHEQYGVKANSIEDIVANLRDARTRYEFDRCTIARPQKLVNIKTT